ncbi:MAG: hypothetical protein ACE5HL_06050 [Terriglobia bacterium]
MTVGLGGIFAGWLAARWQRKVLTFQLQLRVFEELSSQLADWMKTVFFDKEEEKRQLDHRVFITAQVVRALFGQSTWQALSDFRNAASCGKKEGESAAELFDRVQLAQKYFRLMKGMADDMGLNLAKSKKSVG